MHGWRWASGGKGRDLRMGRALGAFCQAERSLKQYRESKSSPDRDPLATLTQPCLLPAMEVLDMLSWAAAC